MLILFLAACLPDRIVDWCGDDVRRARILELAVYRFAAVGGLLKGAGLLQADLASGGRCEQPIRLDGGMVGVTVDLTYSTLEASLELPAGGVAGEDLFGRYEGSAAAGVAGFGVTTLHLRNGHDVEIDQPGLGAGVGAGNAYTWLDLTPGEGRDLDTGDSAQDSE